MDFDDFKIGDKVIELESGRKGRIVEIVSTSRRGVVYSVLFIGATREEQIRDIYLKLDFDITNPFTRCKQHLFSSFTDFSRINTSYKIENTSNSTISSLKASKTIFKPYQFKPLLKFISSDNKRLLVADEVGLGKTIEAGHIMLEMKARKDLRNVLIVCPKALQEKWRSELEEKFSLNFTIYDRVQDFIQDLRTRDGAFRGILSYSRIARKKSDEDMEDPTTILGYINKNQKKFSLILCDEAHRMRNHSTQTYKGAEFLMSRTDAGLFLTATPIMLNNENLYNLLHLLDEQTYDNKEDFQNSLNLNQPFMEALRQLKTKTSLPKIADELDRSKVTTYYQYTGDVYSQHHTIGSYYKEDPIYQRIIKWMYGEKDTAELRAKLQYELTSMSEISNIFSRTRKREVTKDWTQAERHPFPYSVELYPDEREIFDDIINTYIEDNSYIDDWGDIVMERGAAMGLVTKKRYVASSVYGYLNDDDDLDKGIDRYEDCNDAKVDTLVSIMKELFSRGENKIIVFVLFKRTLKYLNIRLKKQGFNCAMIHGDVKDRDSVLKTFKNDPECNVLLSSEVGSEGLDMQFSCSMVNYDLPWNPMVVEQRIGRIDRFGQQSPVVKIYNLIVKDSIQQDIYDRLLDRIGIFRSSIGDLEAILQSDFGKNGCTIQRAYTKLEEELFLNKRSREEYLRKVDEIAQAVANEREELKRIEENETNTLTIDSYFQHEIDRILHNNSYLTEKELVNYVQMLLVDALPTCKLRKDDDDMYSFIIPKSTPKVLLRFMDEYHPMGDELEIQLKGFKNLIGESTEFKITFSQEKAFEDKTLIYVNMYHPIILSALNYFKKKDDSMNITFCFDISRTVLPEKINPGAYFMGVYKIINKHLIYGVEKESFTLVPIVYDVANVSIISDEDTVNTFFGKAQGCGKYRAVGDFDIPDSDTIDEMGIEMTDFAAQYVKRIKNDLAMRIESRREKKLQQLEERGQLAIRKFRYTVEMEKEEYASALVRNDKKEIDRLGRTVRLHEGHLHSMENDYEEQCEKLRKDSNLSVRYENVSLSLINVL